MAADAASASSQLNPTTKKNQRVARRAFMCRPFQWLTAHTHVSASTHRGRVPPQAGTLRSTVIGSVDREDSLP
jgi:hypothetical protein